MAKPRIMVVDDDTTFLTLMEELLADEGYPTTTWRQGAQAYAAIKKQTPALVILDIRMEQPETGWQTLEVLRLDPATAPIPVIVCSADGRFLLSKAERLAALGCLILEKPFDLAALLALVTCVLGPP